ncbi:MAG TPA: PEP/pyruvate-binding domain-containing protein, partial [Aminivibrio sp.]|nr:PEP/pyruvate-binding domain-containing protein [Aminivibrio sp.]
DFLSSVPHLDSLLGTKDPELIENAFLATPIPDYAVRTVERYLSRMTDPVVVRSSSRLEDSLKHSFAGKYMSTFLINGPDQPLSHRVDAVLEQMKRIYARNYFPTAASYRRKHGLPEDEMGLILMRMAGKWRGRYFYPAMAGVGFSRNYRRWTTRIRAEDGVLRIVFGLGTLSTKRGYARTFSLSNPMLRPEGLNPFNIMRHSQEAFQAVGQEEGQLLTLNITRSWKDIIPHVPNFRLYAQIYNPDNFGGYFTYIGSFPSFQGESSKICFTFEDFPCRHRRFFEIIKGVLPFLEESMGVPADLEFAYEPVDEKLQLLQCRPLWGGEASGTGTKPVLEDRKILFKADRMV